MTKYTLEEVPEDFKDVEFKFDHTYKHELYFVGYLKDSTKIVVSFYDYRDYIYYNEIIKLNSEYMYMPENNDGFRVYKVKGDNSYERLFTVNY